ncbi:hypothetical protein [Lactobacillus sp. Sy-1]|uniref:hypothetical protein n=1 Tax=Lactobacillus sp. Sy-1 TaxID=2109645 RepID=UPI001C5BC89C|nr:hypothetical protein [Lactobacillus sp. Sy-1]MBW1606075.1 hypothetical protein [Lactobacillus sp. Sy-1]
MKRTKLILASALLSTIGLYQVNNQFQTANASSKPKSIKVYRFKKTAKGYKLVSSAKKKYVGNLKKSSKITYRNNKYYYIKKLKGYVIDYGNPSGLLNGVSPKSERADANHKYIIGTNNHPAELMGEDQFDQLIEQKDNVSFGSTSGFNGFLVHTIKTANVAGYSFTQIDEVTGKNDKEKLWVYSGNLGNKANATAKYVSLDTVYDKQSDILKGQNNSSQSNDDDSSDDKSSNNSNNFTADELSKIKNYQDQAKAIGNVSNPYSTNPSYEKAFNIGQLNPAFTKNVVDWLNFYRQLFGLDTINDDSSWDTEAQYGATALAAANQGLSHGLVGFNKPSFVSQDDWQRGANATNSSNLAEGVSRPSDIITLYLNDSGLANPGHRQWLLGNLTRIGIGQAGDYNAIKVFDDSEKNNSPIWNFSPNPIAYPSVNLCPIDLVRDTYWSYSIPEKLSDFPSYASHYHVLYKDASNESDSYDQNMDSNTVKVHDNTDNKDVPVSGVTLNGGSGNSDAVFTYKPDNNYIKAGHSYTITINGLPNNQSYTYTTKLFSLDDD